MYATMTAAIAAKSNALEKGQSRAKIAFLLG
jgi:hypothetical protein